MVINEMDALKNMFIVDRSAYEQEKLPEFIKKLMRFCKLDSTGKAIIERNDMSIRDRIVAVAIARFLGNKLNPEFSAEISLEDMNLVLGADKKTVSARISGLLDEGILTRPDTGIYSISPYKIEKFLEELSSKYPEKTTLPVLSTKSREKQAINKTHNALKPGVDPGFTKRFEAIDKSKYAFYRHLKNMRGKCLAALKLSKEAGIEKIGSGQLHYILTQVFLDNASWPLVSITLKNLTRDFLVDGVKKEGHSTAKLYFIMPKGEEELKELIREIDAREGQGGPSEGV